MHSSPHPNQVRSACERCRHLKLRCLRPTPTEPSCTRCTRLELHCLAGSQRKVGRPPKKDLVRRPRGNKPPMPTVDAEADEGHSNFQFLDELAEDVPNLAWPTPGSTPFELPNFDDMSLPIDIPSPTMQDVHPSSPNMALVAADPNKPSPNTHFEALSKINVELHKVCSGIFVHASGMNFETFTCFTDDDFQGLTVFKIIMKAAQDYLATIKALHNMLGTRTLPKRQCPYSTPGVSKFFDHMLPNLADMQPTEPPPTESDSEPPQPQAQAQPQGTLDSPIAFLVISCFVQMVRSLEFILTMMHDCVNDSNFVGNGIAGNVSFFEVAILEFSSQLIVAIELVRHVIGQIMLVLGLPSPWSRKSIWTGLLSVKKYRDLLNKELGVVEGLWTTRPARLMELMYTTKEMAVEYSMAGNF